MITDKSIVHTLFTEIGPRYENRPGGYTRITKIGNRRGRKLRVSVSPSVELDELRRGQEVMLNEALNVVEAMEYESVGDIVTLKEILEDGERALVLGHTDEERVVRSPNPCADSPSAPATPCSSNPAPDTSTRSSPRARSKNSSSKRSPTSATSRSVASADRSR